MAVTIVVLVASAALVVWFGRFARRPTSETLGGVASAGPTMVLRSEPPALANALLNRGLSQGDALPGTFLDLAARGHIELFEVSSDRTVVYRTPTTDAVRTYEQLFLVPLTASDSPERGMALEQYVARLDFGVGAALQFERTIHSELLAAGLLERKGGFLSWESLTAAGREAAAHWLGVREFLAADDAMDQLPPAAVAIWDRYLAYAAAFGVAEAATAPIVAAFNRRLPTPADVDAARSAAAAYVVGGAAFDAADFGITTAIPFGPVGAYPVDLRGLLAGWAVAWDSVGRGGPAEPGWGVAFAERVRVIDEGLPVEVADDARALIEALVSGSRGGSPAGSLDWAFTNWHPAAQRLFADCAARAGAGVDSSTEIRRWSILRHLAFHAPA